MQSAPPEFLPEGRASDIDTIVSIINAANQFVYVAVMDYFPLMIYQKPNTYDFLFDFHTFFT